MFEVEDLAPSNPKAIQRARCRDRASAARSFGVLVVPFDEGPPARSPAAGAPRRGARRHLRPRRGLGPGARGRLRARAGSRPDGARRVQGVDAAGDRGGRAACARAAEPGQDDQGEPHEREDPDRPWRRRGRGDDARGARAGSTRCPRSARAGDGRRDAERVGCFPLITPTPRPATNCRGQRRRDADVLRAAAALDVRLPARGGASRRRRGDDRSAATRAQPADARRRYHARARRRTPRRADRPHTARSSASPRRRSGAPTRSAGSRTRSSSRSWTPHVPTELVTAREIEQRGGMTIAETQLVALSFGLAVPEPDEAFFDARRGACAAALPASWRDLAARGLSRTGPSLRPVARRPARPRRSSSVWIVARPLRESGDRTEALDDGARGAPASRRPLADPLLLGVHIAGTSSTRSRRPRCARPSGPRAMRASARRCRGCRGSSCDLKEFTAYTDVHGDAAAIAAIEHFGAIVTGELGRTGTS